MKKSKVVEEPDYDPIYVDLNKEQQLLRYAATVDYSVLSEVAADVFHGRAERIIFETLKVLQSHFIPSDLLDMVMEHINDANYDLVQDAVSDILKASKLTTRNAALAVYASLRTLYSQRVIQETCQVAQDLSREGNVDEAYSELRAILVTSGELGVETGDYIEDYAERKSIIKNRKSDDNTMIPTGIIGLDEVTGGLQKSETAVVLARTGGGKSVAMLNFTLAAWVAGFNVVHIGLEMTKHETEFRMDSLLTTIPYWSYRVAKLKDADYKLWEKTIKHYKKNKKNYMEFVSARNADMSDILSLFESTENRRGQKADMLVLDHFVLVKNRQRLDFHMQQWANFQDLKEFTQARKIVTWSAGQVTDEGIGRKNGMRTTDMKYGRAPGELAHLIIALHESQEDSVSGDMSIQFLKGRGVSAKNTVSIRPNFDRMMLDQISYYKLNMEFFAQAGNVKR